MRYHKASLTNTNSDWLCIPSSPALGLHMRFVELTDSNKYIPDCSSDGQSCLQDNSHNMILPACTITFQKTLSRCYIF